MRGNLLLMRQAQPVGIEEEHTGTVSRDDGGDGKEIVLAYVKNTVNPAQLLSLIHI